MQVSNPELSGWTNKPRRLAIVVKALFFVNHFWRNKLARTVIFIVVFIVTPLFIPPLQNKLSVKGESYQELLPHAQDLVTFKQNSATATPLAVAEVTESLEAPKPANQTCADQLIDDPSNSMEAFNAALARSEGKEKGAITRITHYGDSPITNDGITGTTRQLLQERFGDSGHGFILID